MQKASFAVSAALAVGLTSIASSAFADHGAEYVVSACDMTGENTAQIEITDVGNYEADPRIEAVARETFEELMSTHTVEEHQTSGPAYINDLVNLFSKAQDALLEQTGRDVIYLDFHHPREDAGGPVVPGCNR